MLRDADGVETRADAHFRPRHLLAILREPDEAVLQVESGVGGPPVVVQPVNVLEVVA
jgi:hypothetical protein